MLETFSTKRMKIKEHCYEHSIWKKRTERQVEEQRTGKKKEHCQKNMYIGEKKRF